MALRKALIVTGTSVFRKNKLFAIFRTLFVILLQSTNIVFYCHCVQKISFHLQQKSCYQPITGCLTQQEVDRAFRPPPPPAWRLL